MQSQKLEAIFLIDKHSYYINDKNNDKEDEINSYDDANNVGDNSCDNNNNEN